MVNLLGLVSQGTANYNYDKTGRFCPRTGINRDFADDEYEAFVQDRWHVSRGLTVTVGCRRILPAMWEVNGYQTSSNVSLSDWFNQRGALARRKPQSLATPLAFNLSDSLNGTPLYPTVHNFAPRVALAYSPQSAQSCSANC